VSLPAKLNPDHAFHRPLQKGKPALDKPVTGELGCTTPYIIVPGVWSRGDLEYHARAVATGKLHNAGHNCLAAELLITAADWPQREEFLDIVRWATCHVPIFSLPGGHQVRVWAGLKLKFCNGAGLI
jgi:hypothetical protein